MRVGVHLYRFDSVEPTALRQELALIDEEVGLTTMRAPVSGIVLTPHLQEHVGASLEEGDLLLTLGRTDSLELEFGVDQRDVGRVRPGQQVRFRVEALPQRSTWSDRRARSVSSRVASGSLRRRCCNGAHSTSWFRAPASR